MSTTDQAAHFADVTEMAGQKVPAVQLRRTCHRYYWARDYIAGKDVLEAACGSGPGLGYLAAHAKSLAASDISVTVLDRARETYGNRFALIQGDAQHLPFAEASLDAVLLFEAIYYLPDAAAFVAEVRRVLRPGGSLLIVTANKDLFDFNPSPYSTAYFGVAELGALVRAQGFEPEFFGYDDITRTSLKQRLLRPAKLLASRLGLIPKTMKGKEALKRFVFGSMVDMPGDIQAAPFTYAAPERIEPDRADRRHKVLYCAALLR